MHVGKLGPQEGQVVAYGVHDPPQEPLAVHPYGVSVAEFFDVSGILMVVVLDQGVGILT